MKNTFNGFGDFPVASYSSEDVDSFKEWGGELKHGGMQQDQGGQGANRRYEPLTDNNNLTGDWFAQEGYIYPYVTEDIWGRGPE